MRIDQKNAGNFPAVVIDASYRQAACCTVTLAESCRSFRRPEVGR
jgi:hypothetical protein